MKISNKTNFALVMLHVCLFLYVHIAAPILLNTTSSALWGWSILLVALLTTNPIWALYHEAFHSHLFSDKKMNDLGGHLLGYCQTTSFSLIQYYHLLHHRYNRTLPEYDLYDPKKSSYFSASCHYYTTLFFGFYVQETVLPLLIILPKNILFSIRQTFNFHFLTQEVMAKLFSEDRILRKARTDIWIALIIVTASLFLYRDGWKFLLGFYLIRGFLLSFLDYIYHYRTSYELNFGMNLFLPKPLSACLLHFNFHGVHHRHPSIPWKYLPQVFEAEYKDYDGNYVWRTLSQLRGVYTAQEAEITPRQNNEIIFQKKPALVQNFF